MCLPSPRAPPRGPAQQLRRHLTPELCAGLHCHMTPSHAIRQHLQHSKSDDTTDWGMAIGTIPRSKERVRGNSKISCSCMHICPASRRPCAHTCTCVYVALKQPLPPAPHAPLQTIARQITPCIPFPQQHHNTTFHEALHQAQALLTAHTPGRSVLSRRPRQKSSSARRQGIQEVRTFRKLRMGTAASASFLGRKSSCASTLQL